MVPAAHPHPKSPKVPPPTPQRERDAREELLFCSLNLLFFDVPVAVVIVVS